MEHLKHLSSKTPSDNLFKSQSFSSQKEALNKKKYLLKSSNSCSVLENQFSKF